MKPILLATAAGLACAAGLHAQPQPTAAFNTNVNIFGSSFGDGQDTQQVPLTYVNEDTSRVFAATGGSGQTGGGLVSGNIRVAEIAISVAGSIMNMPGSWVRSRFSTHGEGRILQSGYTVEMSSFLGISAGSSELKLTISNASAYFFIESSGLLGGTSLTDGVNTYQSGSIIPTGTYTMVGTMNHSISLSNANSHPVSDGVKTVYLAVPRCASALNWSQRATTGPSPRFLTATAFDRDRGRVVVFGGGTSSPLVRYNDLWEWDGIAWTQRQADDGAAAGRPGRRRACAATYDSAAHRMYLFGGENDTGYLKEFWRLDLATLTWTNLSAGVPAGLVARWAPSLVYDRERSVVVLYGGSSPSSNPTDTWEFNGTSWALKSSPTNPGARDSAGMVYDTLRGRTLIFGGGSATTLPATDTPWVWDGTAWTALTTNPGPTPRYGPGLAFDEVRGTVVLMGGATLPILNDTWELNGSTWTHVFPTTPPTGRAGPAMVYDATHANIVAFGGLNSGGGYEGDTWAYSWPQIKKHPVNVSVAVGQNTSFSVETSATPTSYQWFKGATPIGSSNVPTLPINNVQASSVGSYTCIVTFPCGTQTSAAATLTIASCYANCDGSSVNPVLNANDFQCFLNKFAASDSYANCDGSSVNPVLNANDFQCFLNQFAAGCS